MMRGGNDCMDSFRDSLSCHEHRILYCFRPVVNPRQYMTMYINHPTHLHFFLTMIIRIAYYHLIKCTSAYLRPDNTFARSINFLLKSNVSAGGFYLTTYRSGRLLL